MFARMNVSTQVYIWSGEVQITQTIGILIRELILLVPTSVKHSVILVTALSDAGLRPDIHASENGAVYLEVQIADGIVSIKDPSVMR